MASSGSKGSLDDAVGASERRVSPRHFHAGPNPPAGEQEEVAEEEKVAEVVAVADASVLHRHALESIFAPASLADLHSLMSVCKQWRAAVLSMAPCGLSVSLDQSCRSKLLAMCLSSIGRHVGTLSIAPTKMSVSAEQMALMHFRLRNLTSLELRLEVDAAPLQFPPLLRSMNLDLSQYSNVAALQQVIDAISQLRHLERLRLGFNKNNQHALCGGISLASLARTPTLTSLELDQFLFSEQHLQQLRSLHQLRRLCPRFSVLPVSDLLASPHQLQLTELDSARVMSEEDAAALTTLPSLQTSKLGCAISHADFLLHLPALTLLGLAFTVASPTAVDIPRVMDALAMRTQLTELTLQGNSRFDFTSEQLAICLRPLSVLQRLSLHFGPSLVSLSFLATGTLAATLTGLDLVSSDRRVPLVELQKVHQLRALRSLKLTRMSSKHSSIHSLRGCTHRRHSSFRHCRDLFIGAEGRLLSLSRSHSTLHSSLSPTRPRASRSSRAVAFFASLASLA